MRMCVGGKVRSVYVDGHMSVRVELCVFSQMIMGKSKRKHRT